jgi:crossover junction endodeoxyribonuclease RusA
MSFHYYIVVPGRPRPKGRPRVGRGGHMYTPKDTADYEKKIQEASHGVVDGAMESNDLQFTVRAYFKNKTHGDLDNYVKIAQDALNKRAFVDDKQIKKIEGELFYVKTAAEERLEIGIKDRRV